MVGTQQQLLHTPFVIQLLDCGLDCSDILNATARVEKQINTLVGDEIETTVQGMNESLLCSQKTNE